MYTYGVEQKETYTSFVIPDINTILPVTKEQPEQNSGINANYLTIGVGSIISILLFVITMQLCKNSQFANRKKTPEHKGYCSQVGNESSNQIEDAGDGEYKTIPLSLNKKVNLCRKCTTCTIKSMNVWSWGKPQLFQIQQVIWTVT